MTDVGPLLIGRERIPMGATPGPELAQLAPQALKPQGGQEVVVVVFDVLIGFERRNPTEARPQGGKCRYCGNDGLRQLLLPLVDEYLDLALAARISSPGCICTGLPHSRSPFLGTRCRRLDRYGLMSSCIAVLSVSSTRAMPRPGVLPAIWATSALRLSRGAPRLSADAA